MDVVRYLIIFTPFFGSLTAFFLLFFELLDTKKQTHKTVKILMLYFLSIMISFASIYFYYYNHIIFAYINSLVMFFFVMIQILFYRFVFEITKLKKKEKFNTLHYLFPLLVFLIFLIIGLTTPLSDQIEVIKAKGECVGDSFLFCKISNSKFPVRFIISIIYTTLSFLRLFSYRSKVANFSSNYEKSSLHWVNFYLIFSLVLITIPFLGVIISRDVLTSSYFMIVHVFLLLIQYAFVCYNTIKENYTVFDSEQSTNNEKEKIDIQEDNNFLPEKIFDSILSTNLLEQPFLKKQLLSKDLIERIMTQQKPFLNPNLKITDLTFYLNTNRTYLSSFINKEYEMNFNKFINQYRLSEFYKLKNEKNYKHFRDKDLAEIAGFGSYKNFMRFVNSG